MVLVLFLLGFILLLSIVAFLLLVSTLKINIKKLQIDNTRNTKKINRIEFLAELSFYLLGKWKILKIQLDHEKLQKINLKKRIEKIDVKKLKQEFPINKETWEMIRKFPIELEEFSLKLKVGTIDVIFTTIVNMILIGLLSVLFATKIKKYDARKYQYEIKPMYGNKNMVKLDFACIITIKMVHIMDILYLVLKKGRVKKNGRTSNRRSYDYSYE